VRYRASLPSTRPALRRAVRAVMSVARKVEGLAASRANVEIAVREALANAFIHGNRLERAKRVLLRCYVGPQSGILVLVRDEGPGFDPDRVPDPRHPDRRELHHGRGLLLMRELMDQVEYRRGGREVLLRKRCG
jgi:serine/threonine-protein kinase RsbW